MRLSLTVATVALAASGPANSGREAMAETHDNRIEDAIGGDTFRLPATVRTP